MSTEIDDDGTMPENVETLAAAVVGHRIVEVERGAEAPRRDNYWGTLTGLRITLDDGTGVYLFDTSDCCAFAELEDVIEHLPTLDHIITAVRADDGYDRWHIIADLGEVLELVVGWSAGNPFYYGYGFDIAVVPGLGGSRP